MSMLQSALQHAQPAQPSQQQHLTDESGLPSSTRITKRELPPESAAANVMKNQTQPQNVMKNQTQPQNVMKNQTQPQNVMKNQTQPAEH
jgi:hypothetical protein